MQRILKMFRNEEGQILVFVAIAMVAIMGFSALAIDVGMVSIQKSNLQNAADAAALAGAQDIGTENDPEDTAIAYADKNGGSGISTAVNPTNTDPTKIEVVCTKTVKYSFARMLKLTETNVSARAVAQKKSGILSNSTFGYAVFAGNSQLKWNGGNFVIGGDIYGDKGVKLTGNGSVIDGDVAYNTGSVNIGGTYSGISTQKKETMPDFSQLVKEQAIANGNHFANQEAFKAKYYGHPEIPAVPATDAVYDKKGKLIKPANPGSPAIPASEGEVINGSIWVDGDLDIDKPVYGKGIIYADGKYSYSYSDAETSSMASICFYSAGSITFNGGSGKISGILYAPNGEITINGTPKENKIWGRMIANDVTVNGNGYTVVSRDSDLEWTETLGVNPTYKLVE